MRALLASAVLLLSGCGQYSLADVGADIPEEFAWAGANSETGQVRDLQGLENLASSFPDSTSVRLRLLNAQLEAETYEDLLGTLSWLNDRGYVFSSTARAQIPKHVGEEFAERATRLLREPPEPLERSEIVATVPADAGLVESVLMDLEGGNIAVSSVSGKNLWGKGPRGNWSDHTLEGAGNLSGIVYDPGRALVLAASGKIDGSDGSQPFFSGLVGIKFPGDTPRFFPAPVGSNLSDLHRSPDGTIYASDPLGGGIYRLLPGAETIEILVPPGTFRSPQGLVTSDDGKRLYVSDYRYGLAAVDLDSGDVHLVPAKGPFPLDGIDGLWRRGDELIAVQNGTSPMRIVALQLSSDGKTVVGQRNLEVSHRDWTEPLSGYLGPDALYYVGNGQWDRWIAGQPAQDKPFLPTQIRRLPLD